MAQVAQKIEPALRLGSKTLASLPTPIARPAYDWQKTPVGIVHISLGAFHRSHQAMYTDDVLAQEEGTWGICGVGALPSDRKLIDSLHAQDHLYSVLMRGAQKKEVRVLGSLREAMLLPGDPAAVIKRLSDPAIKILSLTITEKGYCHNPQTGLLDEKHPIIAHDLQHPDQPQSAIGLIAAAMKERMAKGMAPFTVLSCDNLPGNGHKTASIVTAFARLQDEKLAKWIEQNVAFPNTMVDRITPVTTDEDKAGLTRDFGYIDEALVVCEPFRQWVLEDKFTLGRPAWERAGAQFVPDVSPYELAKIRLLNVSHTVFAYPAFLMGYVFVSDGASDPRLAKYVRQTMDNEITPTLPPVPGMDLESYKTTIIERFANPSIKDTWERICSDGSQKIANQLVPIVRERLAKGQSAKGLAFLVAAWFRYLTGSMDNGETYSINDPMAAQLQKIAVVAKTDPMPLLSVSEIFGKDLSARADFAGQVRTALNLVYTKDMKAALEAYCKQ